MLNEEEVIEQLLHYLITHISLEYTSEIIVVDGGSTDGTLTKVNTFILNRAQSTSYKISLLNSEKGRAKQMNLGAAQAKGDILYFLHADSFPPNMFDQLIVNEVESGNLAGCFRMQFNSKHWWLRLASWLTQFKWRACRGGDQSQFITKILFDAIGGYNENYIIYEDNILINELYKRKQFTVINKKLKTSARLYTKVGVWTLQYHFWTIYVKRWFGASAEDLYEYYKAQISKKI